MRERVNVINGKNPVLLIVPHGADGDDTNTAVLGERVAKLADCYAVINNGFNRADHPDPDNDLADCNRVDHAESEIVVDEFLKPILKIRERIVGNLTLDPGKQALLVLHLHGAGNLIHKEAGEKVGVVVGYGLGKEHHSITCQKWRRKVFIKNYRLATESLSSTSAEVYEGAGGGKFAGRNSNNMNQFFRKYDPDPFVQSLQLEFPFSERENVDQVENTAEKLALTIAAYMQYHKEIEETDEIKGWNVIQKLI